MPENKETRQKEPNKIIVWLAALLVIAAIAGMVWLILSLLLPPTGEITPEDIGGFRVVAADGSEMKFAESRIYLKNGDVLEEGEKLVPAEVQSEVDFPLLSDEFFIAFDGKAEPNQTFEVYSETSGYEECISKPSFLVPEDDGKYLVRLTATWEKGENRQVNEYIFGITVEAHEH